MAEVTTEQQHTTAGNAGVAQALWAVMGRPPLQVVGPSGDVAGPAADAVGSVRLTSRDALRHLIGLGSPAELGLARAYVSGALQVDGDLYAALAALSARPSLGGLRIAEKAALLRATGPGALIPLPPPPQEVVPGTRLARSVRAVRRHSRVRDAASISHHYDVSNTFYRWVLGPSMAYTCAVYATADATLEQAQAEKFDLVCRKLDLRPGMRLLDVGCGWGGMVRHAVTNYGVSALGVTLSRQQAEWAQKAIADDGLSAHAEVRWGDYREVRETGFDAVSSIGLTEHIGLAQIPGYFAFLRSRLRPQGRLLNHCITRQASSQPPAVRRGFINRYVFPDGELPTAGRVVTQMADAGIEVRHAENLREHYAMTLRDWGRNLRSHWDEAVAEVGLPTARVWELYMAGSRLGFATGSIELHQVLGVRSDEGRSDVPLRLSF